MSTIIEENIDTVSIALDPYDVANMADFCDELTDHCFNAHLYLQTVNSIFNHLKQKEVNPDTLQTFNRVKDKIAELFSLLQIHRNSIQSVGVTLNKHADEL